MSTHAMDPTTLVDRRVHIIDDLLGAILLLAAAALAVLLDLTRRQICAVYQLAFALCGTSAFFIVGGLIDHHLSNDQLTVALYGSYLSSSLTTSYIYLPLLASLGVSLAVVLSLSTCSCDCCCLVGAAAATHQRCFGARIRANLSLYSACFGALYVAIGTRLNVRLRESAINPVGGTLHWTLLRVPFYLAMAHIGSLLLVALKIFLQHADRPSHAQTHGPVGGTAVPLPPNARSSANPTTVEELMRPPPVKNFALAPPRRTSDTKHTLPRSPRVTTTATATGTAAISTTVASKPESRTASPRHAMATAMTKAVARRASSTSSDNNNREPQHDGDVSSLISSDSDSDDGVLRPSFRAKALPPRHAAPTSSGVRKRPSGGAVSTTSGYSSSPPPSPTHSTVSTGSSSAFSTARLSRGITGSGTRPGSASSSSSSARPRLTSSGSSSSTTFLSDTDDHVLSNLEAYGSSGTESAAPYPSGQRGATGGIRRRAPRLHPHATASGTGTGTRPLSATATAATAISQTLYQETTAASSEWIECLDEASGSAYYYNTRSGESRWKDHSS